VLLFYQIGLEEEEKEAGDAVDVDAQRKTRSAVVRTSTRQTIFLPIPGLVETDKLKPSDLVGTNKDSYLILEKLPDEFDSRVQAMEVDEKPTEEYSDIGGADLQIQELIEAVVLPMTHKEMFDSIGIRPPKGVLLHGPPGTCWGFVFFNYLCCDCVLLQYLTRNSIPVGRVVVEQALARRCWPARVPIRPMRSFSNSPARSWYKCSLATAPS
jgi:Proteasomal ATPase OB C-terminal domain